MILYHLPDDTCVFIHKRHIALEIMLAGQHSSNISNVLNILFKNCIYKEQ